VSMLARSHGTTLPPFSQAVGKTTPVGRLALALLLAAMLVGCAAPAAAKGDRIPDSVLSSLAAQERGDVSEFLDGFALEEASEARQSYEARYLTWLADAAAADAIASEVEQVQPLGDGRHRVVTRTVALCDGRDEILSQVFSTNGIGKIVDWTVTREPLDTAIRVPSSQGNGKTDPPRCGYPRGRAD
jgi:hypothetical protein